MLMRRWIDLTNEAQHGGTREVSLERAEEKKSVDRQRRSDGVDLCSLRSLTRVPSITLLLNWPGAYMPRLVSAKAQ